MGYGTAQRTKARQGSLRLRELSRCSNTASKCLYIPVCRPFQKTYRADRGARDPPANGSAVDFREFLSAELLYSSTPLQVQSIRVYLSYVKYQYQLSPVVELSLPTWRPPAYQAPPPLHVVPDAHLPSSHGHSDYQSIFSDSPAILRLFVIFYARVNRNVNPISPAPAWVLSETSVR